MFSLPSIRNPSTLIKPVLANQRSNSVRPVFNQSQDSGSSSPSFLKPSFGGSGSGEKKSGDELLLLLLRSISSGVLIVGSSLSFCYLSHSGVSFRMPRMGLHRRRMVLLSLNMRFPKRNPNFSLEILKLESAHYDYKLHGTISAKDFALSLVASADISHINKLLDRVEELNNESHLRDIRVTFEEFKNFAELRKKIGIFFSSHF
ncbi:hypothetical protein CRYUN_Cryun33cG0035400 [Craigia yunnanensis]